MNPETTAHVLCAARKLFGVKDASKFIVWLVNKADQSIRNNLEQRQNERVIRRAYGKFKESQV